MPHTPGPWKIEPEGDRDLLVMEATDPFGEVAWIANRYHGERDRATEQANALLIAAAPETADERDRLREINAELLLACERAMAAYDRAASGEPRVIWRGEDVDFMRAAVGKARSKS